MITVKNENSPHKKSSNLCKGGEKNLRSGPGWLAPRLKPSYRRVNFLMITDSKCMFTMIME